jgi:S1-C subfamily serine protease
LDVSLGRKKETPMKQKILVLSFIMVLLLTACSGTASLGSQPTTNLVGQIAQVNPTPTTAAAAPISLSSGALEGYQSALEALYARVSPSVVSVQVIDQTSASSSQINPFPNNPGNQGNNNNPQYSQGLGSGFVWDAQGDIVTNNHVVDGATNIQVTFYDGTTVPATVVGRDPDSDLAVIKVSETSVPLVPVQMADSTQVKVGQVAIAIGNPFGLQNTMTVGIISGLGRSLPTNLTGTGGLSYTIPDIIQTDAPINPGNSGGVLLNDQGQVLGVTSAIESPVQASVGIGLVIPSSIVSRVVPQLISTGTYQHPYLGVTIASMTPDVATAMKLNAGQRGALVVDIASGGPAEKAGLQGSNGQTTIAGQAVQIGGDVIVAVNGQTIKSSDDLIAYLADNTNVGQKVTLTILRGGAQKSVDVTLAARPAQQPSQATQPQSNNNGSVNNGVWLGISALTLVPQIAQQMGLPANQSGVLVEQVVTGSPAEKAGLQAGTKTAVIGNQSIVVGGDVITAIDGTSITSMLDLQTFLSTAQAGQQVTLDILRNGQSQKVMVTLAERPSNTP